MINIFFNIDEDYKTQCKAVIRSIKEHTNQDVCFHIIGVKNFDYDANIKCYDKPDLSILTHTVQMAHITMTSTYRLFAPFILKDIDKAIYLDADLIVLDDIAKLWEFEPEYIAGVADPMYKRQARKNDLKHLYINSGVMVLNLKNLRAMNDYMDKIKETQSGNYNLSLLDQDIINIAFGDKIEHLPLKWNVYAKIYPETTYDMINARENPSIIHWCGKEKPWKDEVWQRNKWSSYEY